MQVQKMERLRKRRGWKVEKMRYHLKGTPNSEGQGIPLKNLKRNDWKESTGVGRKVLRLCRRRKANEF
jgi:hypothetical protein